MYAYDGQMPDFTTSERSRNLAQGQEFAKGEFLTLGGNSRSKQQPQRGCVSPPTINPSTRMVRWDRTHCV